MYVSIVCTTKIVIRVGVKRIIDTFRFLYLRKHAIKIISKLSIIRLAHNKTENHSHQLAVGTIQHLHIAYWPYFRSF